MKTKKKNVYCVGWGVGPNSFGVTNTYLEFAKKYGNAKILMPHQITPPDDCDILILPGGLDLASENYNEHPSFGNTNIDQFKQHFINNGLKNYINAKIPIFGICLGFQQLAAYFQLGKYVQNLQWHPSSKDRYEEAHDVEFVNNNLFQSRPEKKTGKITLSVNGHHRQGVLLPDEMMHREYNGDYKVGPIQIETIYPNGIETTIESFYHTELPIFAIQAHPEEAISFQMEMYAKKAMNYLLSFTEETVRANVGE